MSRRILTFFAKQPQPGQVKTRLTPPLTQEQAAEFYEAMLLDIAHQFANREEDRALWFWPESARDWFERNAAFGARLIPQRGETLGQRMAALFRAHEDEGYDRIVLRGTDSPTLPSGHVDMAFRALDAADLVLCPDLDGGYNLIGLRGACDELFDLEMSTASVMQRTLERAHSLGLSRELLPAHHDVDTIEDVRRLRAALGSGDAPRTRAWLLANGIGATGAGSPN